MYSHVAENKRKTVYLILTFVLFITAIGWIFSQVQGNFGIFIGVLIFAVVYSFVGYYSSAKIALALSGAKKIDKSQSPRLYRIVENMSITSGLPMPDVYIINDPAPNAFATGRDPENAAVAASTGLLDMLDDSELEGVIAHEMSHIGNYDIRVMAIVIVLVTIIAFVSDIFMRMMFFGGRDDNQRGSPIFLIIGIIAAIAAPVVATLLRLAVSRKREYLADASGALLTRYPEGLASALEKISSYPKPMRNANASTSHLFISNPLKGKKSKSSFIASLFSTHPPAEERIKRLREMNTHE